MTRMLRTGDLIFMVGLPLLAGYLCSRALATLPEAAADLPTASAGILSYVVSCALKKGESATLLVNDKPHVFEGELGLAPHWTIQGLDTEDQRRVTACVLARTNRRGRTVPIELRPWRDPPEAPAHADATPSLTGDMRMEGGFFGNLFSAPPRLYACTGDLLADRSVWLERSGRECALSDAAAASRCGFDLVGHCDEQAFMRPEGNYLNSALFVWLPSNPTDERQIPVPSPESAKEPMRATSHACASNCARAPSTSSRME